MAIREAADVMGQNELRWFLSDWSIEIVPIEGVGLDPALRSVTEGTRVYVTSIPGRNLRCAVDASARLRKANFHPVPHISARALIDRNQLNELLAQLRSEADVDSALLLGGDIDDGAVGAFASSRAMLETGLFARHGFKRVGFATYPEPHPRVAQEVLESELVSKLRLATEQGIESWLVSQLCFSPDTIIRHAERLRARGALAPLHVGVAGPTSWKSMAKFALICGVSNSARSFSTQASRVGRLFACFEPTEILSRLALTASAKPNLGLIKPHFFTFGGAEKTVNWVNSFSSKTSRTPHQRNGASREQSRA
jgi:methylenetetrahydrofolate reductase (NADPH)